MKNLLITGGCGFLGANLAHAAMERGYRLTVVDNLSRKGADLNLDWLKTRGSFEFIRADVRDPAQTRVAFSSKPDIVFHLAGQVAMTTSIADPRLDFETNALGTLNVLEAMREHCPKATVIYSSTNKVYGDLGGVEVEERETRYTCPGYPDGIPESARLDFHSPYGVSKGSADQMILDYSRIFGMNGVVFRHSSIFGDRQFSTFDQGWVGWFVQQAIETVASPKHSFTISGNGKQVRDVLFSSDLIRCYFSAVESIASIRGEAFNIGGGMENSLSLLELFAFLESKLKIRMNPRPLDWRQSDQKFFVADIRKAQERMRWSPEVNWKTGVTRMIDWVKSNRG